MVPESGPGRDLPCDRSGWARLCSTAARWASGSSTGFRRWADFITLDDLRANKPNWVEPISVPFRGYRVWELPPNNQGVAVLEMLRILEPYDLKAMGHNSAPYLHHLIEAKKLAYADLERFVGDPAAMTTAGSRLLVR